MCVCVHACMCGCMLQDYSVNENAFWQDGSPQSSFKQLFETLEKQGKNINRVLQNQEEIMVLS